MRLLRLRPRLRLRTLLIAVAVAAVILAIEAQVVRLAVLTVSEHGDGERYVVSEATLAWAIAHAPVAGLLFMVALMYLARPLPPSPPRPDRRG